MWLQIGKSKVRDLLCWLGTLNQFWYECDLLHSCTEFFCLSLKSSAQTIQSEFNRDYFRECVKHILYIFLLNDLKKGHFIYQKNYPLTTTTTKTKGQLSTNQVGNALTFRAT